MSGASAGRPRNDSTNSNTIIFAIPTYRLRDVAETIERYDEQFWSNGHSVKLMVFDDSSLANHEKCVSLLEQTKIVNELYYVGPGEKGQFIQFLCRQLSRVVIRAARDNFSAAAKDAFIRYLATEGFIAERFRCCSEDPNHAARSVKWLTDNSWVRLSHRCPRLAAQSRALLTWGRCLALGSFLVALAVALWLKPR